MTITAVSALNAPAATSSSSSTTDATSSSISSSLNVDFATYLKILTTQLENQDPTNATDPNQFTQELIQIEQVQVQNNTNSDLENLTKASSANSLATGVGYIGSVVQANSSNDEFALQSSYAQFGYTLASAAASTSVTVKDSSGNTVATLTGGTAAGGNYVSWNGTETDGSTAPDGTYTFTVNAVDSGGNAIAASNPVALFQVTSVQTNSDGTLQLLAGSLSLSTSDVTDVYAASTVPKATSGTGSTASTTTSSTSS